MGGGNKKNKKKKKIRTFCFGLHFEDISQEQIEGSGKKLLNETGWRNLT